ncbi:hypothetical protein BKA70DRAFT_1341804 [Coprinopsis sp. MPI-PUGE-AT-0042]|nr:hypothetical protein BKA70DRAFT_1341804 [Coprinopsis sp. MPI-PUGE-AT-0042]
MDAASELDTIVSTSPPELAPYVSSNDALPSHLSTSLDAYLANFSQPMESLEAEISALEELLNFKKQSYERAKAVRDAHLRIMAPVRRVPQDVLGVIFPYAVDIPPFNKYIHVAYLRSVCSLWRHVAKTTPGLWTSLEVNLDKWYSRQLDDCERDTLLIHFQEVFSPWTSILSKTIPYQLNLTSSDGYSPKSNQIDHKHLLVDYLFHLTPSPNVVTVGSWSALMAALASNSGSTRKLRLRDCSIGRQEAIHLEFAFPNLEVLISDSQFDSGCLPFGHPTLSILHLDNVRGTATSFMHMMQGLPALRALKLNSSNTFDIDDDDDDDDDTPYPPKRHPHPCLEVLFVKGEDLLFLFRFLTFPALRFLTLEGLDVHTDPILADQIVPRTLSTSSSIPFTVSFRGRLYQPFMEQIIASLPRSSYIHLAPSRILDREGYYVSGDAAITIESNNVEGIFSDTNPGGSSWVLSRRENRNSSSLLTVHMPSDVGDTEVNKRRWEALEGAGFRLQLRPAAEIDSMLRSLAPEYRRESPWAAGGLQFP